MDKLSNMKACAKAGFGVHYGKWKATQPIKEIHKEVRRCEACGKEMLNCNKNRRFCDENCRRNAGYKKKLPSYSVEHGEYDAADEKKCEWCGKVIDGKRRDARWCSNNCAASASYYRRREQNGK